jgi:hypothetical protein
LRLALSEMVDFRTSCNRWPESSTSNRSGSLGDLSTITQLPQAAIRLSREHDNALAHHFGGGCGLTPLLSTAAAVSQNLLRSTLDLLNLKEVQLSHVGKVRLP